MNLHNPAYLLLLTLIIAAYVIYRISLARKQKAAMMFSSIGLAAKASKGRWSWRKHVEFILLSVILASMIFALADPHIPLKRIHEGVNVVLVIDVSGSMQANDYKPNRMEAAKLSSVILIDSLQTKDNVGIVIFESGATTASFLTQNKERAKDKLSSIRVSQGRTAIGDGLALAVDMVTSIPNKKKVVILLTDGVNNAGVISPEEAIKFSRENKIQVFTVGIGSRSSTVLGRDFFGNPLYAEFDEELLKRIASETGGQYYYAVDEDTLNQIYRALSQKIEREREDTSIKDAFIGLAILSLLLLLYVMYGKYRVVR